MVYRLSMSGKPPFNNRYTVKHVAFNDSKPCQICFKSTATVLITENSKDWFYVCDSHLSDRNFCSVIYVDDEGNQSPKGLQKMERDREAILKRIHHLETLRDSKDSQFNRFKNYLSWNKDDEDSKKDDKGDKDDKDDKDTSKPSASISDNDADVTELKRRIKTAQSKTLKDINDQITSYKSTHARYRLDKVFYRNRLMMDYKKQKRAKVQKQMKEGTLFPSLEGVPDLPQ